MSIIAELVTLGIITLAIMLGICVLIAPDISLRHHRSQGAAKPCKPTEDQHNAEGQR